jgi:hypothetical protein
MALLSNINDKFAVDSTGAIQFNGQVGTSGYILKSNGNAAPTWVDASTVIGGPYLPLTGGTLSGPLAGTSATFGGNVGIGATSPGAKLVIGTVAGASGGQLNFERTDGAETGQIYMDTSNDLNIKNSGGSGDIILSPHETSGKTIVNYGNVGIGATSPDNKLTVKDTNCIIDSQSTADSQTIGFRAGYTNHATLCGFFRYTTADAQLYIDNNFTGNNGVYSDINFRNKANGGTSLINRMKIKGSSGYVGIGTDDPDAKLQVQGNVKVGSASGQTWTDAKDDIGGLDVFVGSGSYALQLWDDNDQTNPRFVVERAGNVGIGPTLPSSRLQVSESKAGNVAISVQNTNASYSSQIRFLDSTGTEKSAVTFVPSDTSLRFFNNGGDRIIITSGGQVRIGTTNTSALLNVGGPILASDNNQSAGMYVRRTLTLSHPGNTGTFTRTFNPVTQFGISRLGGNVLLEVSGWSQKINCGYIQFQNAGGGGNLTTVSYTQTAVSGTGSISVSINSANDNSIDINFSGWHGNSHAWQARIITQ